MPTAGVIPKSAAMSRDFHLWLRSRRAAARKSRLAASSHAAACSPGPAGLSHAYPFDPRYGHDLQSLCAIEPPLPPEGFAAFWQERYQRALRIDPQPRLAPSQHRLQGFCVFDLEYASTEGFPVRGWLLWPTSRVARRGFVLGHGYGGIESPPSDLPCDDAVYVVPCFRGLSRSRRWPISDDPNYHVLHDIHLRDRYIIGGCVDDLWTGVTALLQVAPHTAGHVGYMGISLGGGVGALGLAWDGRIERAHLNVPTFGNQALRLVLPTVGSGVAVQAFAQQHPQVVETLAFYDAAVAARFIQQPMHVAAALFDPAVAPPGQFSVFNAIGGRKDLFVLTAGHFDFPQRVQEERRLQAALKVFFAPL
ncbi:acetylxylan esterase [Accumulibacter sp.]|uniref:Acetyl xylan esterase n=1 Tax=Accumulibacter regalis TaxID=522306 RepID=C7RV79_ACCRE|nr:acetylxylan esterase [Accumulibacter sp.]